MSHTTVARGSFLIRLRVQSDGRWAGRLEHIASGIQEAFHSQQQLLERLAALVAGGEQTGALTHGSPCRDAEEA